MVTDGTMTADWVTCMNCGNDSKDKYISISKHNEEIKRITEMYSGIGYAIQLHKDCVSKAKLTLLKEKYEKLIKNHIVETNYDNETIKIYEAKLSAIDEALK